MAPRLRVKIIKPLFAIATTNGLCRPDFIIETAYGNHAPVRLIVEAMGMDSDVYLAAKAKTLPRMKEIGPLFEITPDDLRPANATDRGRDLLRWVLDHAKDHHQSLTGNSAQDRL